jgi:hypothetical protein
LRAPRRDADRIAEIAANALNRPNWDRAAFARDLRELIEPDDNAADAEELTRAVRRLEGGEQ